MKLDDVINKLGLVPLLNEGGMVKEHYNSPITLKGGTVASAQDDRPLYRCIYYLLTSNSFSSMHVLNNEETWFYHGGPALEMLLVYPDNHSEIVKLGMNLDEGEIPQYTIGRGVYQGCHMSKDGEYTLVSTMMAPAYSESDFTIATFEQLKDKVNKEHLPLLERLTGEIKYK